VQSDSPSTSNSSTTINKSATKTTSNSVASPVRTAQLNVADTSGQLSLSSDTITIGGYGSTTQCIRNINVSAADGTLIKSPTESDFSGFNTGPSNPTPEGPLYTSSWAISVCRANSPYFSGQFYLIVSVTGVNGSIYTSKILVIAQPAAYFSVNIGQVTESTSSQGDTFTVNLTLMPNAYFGTPNVYMGFATGIGCISGTITQAVQYSGQNSYSLDCTMSTGEVQANAGDWVFMTVNVTADYSGGAGYQTTAVQIPPS
jgi:hypothetical protein